MNIKMNAIGLALLAGIGALALPVVSHAGNVGYYIVDGNSYCSSKIGDVRPAITAAGHTPVAVTTLNSASLSPLNALVIQVCQGDFVANADLNTAVSNGMGLVIDVQGHNGITQSNLGAVLPGTPALVFGSGDPIKDISVAVGSPITTGPGGTLTNTNLDTTGIFELHYCELQSASLPAGAQPFLTKPGDTTGLCAFGYASNAGRVAVSSSSLMYALPDNGYPGPEYDLPEAGALTYYINALNWVVGDTQATLSCAEQGYKGMQLVWCKNICEKGYTGQKLQTWLHRWFNQYHTEPACMMEGDEGGEGGNDF